jgi:putative membrane protein
MVKPSRFLSTDDRERVRAAVAEAERTTAGEIRVLVVGRSVPWSWLAGAIVGLAAGGLSWGLLHAASWGHPDFVEALMAVAAALAAALLGARLIPARRAAKDRAVWARARREFSRLGIAKTEGATGVLLMISLHEHEAIVLADRAINDKVAPDTWPREVKVLLDGIRAGRPADGIIATVREVGALLATHFPRKDDDRNELPDDIEIGK